MKKFKIILITNDDFLKKSFHDAFSKRDEIEIADDKKDEKVDLVVFDDLNKKTELKKLLKNNARIIVINLTTEKLEGNIKNLPRPIKINDLLLLVEKSLNKEDADIINLNDCLVNIKKRQIIKENIVLENLTEKEIGLILSIYKNKKISKKDLLNEVWNYVSDIDTKVVESNIYKLRQKFKGHNLKNPILFKDGYYTIN